MTNGKVCTCSRLVHDGRYRYGVRHERGCALYPGWPLHPEYVAGVESAMQTARWSILDDVAEFNAEHGRPAPRGLWDGPTCRGCGGSGVANFTPAPPAEPYSYRCPACNGHGREPR